MRWRLTCGRRGARADVMEWGVYNRQYPKQPRSHHCSGVSSYADLRDTVTGCGMMHRLAPLAAGYAHMNERPSKLFYIDPSPTASASHCIASDDSTDFTSLRLSIALRQNIAGHIALKYLLFQSVLFDYICIFTFFFFSFLLISLHTFQRADGGWRDRNVGQLENRKSAY